MPPQGNRPLSSPAAPGSPPDSVLVLGLGNDVMGDDAVALHVCRALRREHLPGVDIVESPVAGLALLDFLEGRDTAIIIDSITTGKAPPGTVHFLQPDDFRGKPGISPHFVGLADILALADRLGLRFPHNLSIVAVEIEQPGGLHEGLSGRIGERLPRVVDAVRSLLPHPSSPVPG